MDTKHGKGGGGDEAKNTKPKQLGNFSKSLRAINLCMLKPASRTSTTYLTVQPQRNRYLLAGKPLSHVRVVGQICPPSDLTPLTITPDVLEFYVDDATATFPVRLYVNEISDHEWLQEIKQTFDNTRNISEGSTATTTASSATSTTTTAAYWAIVGSLSMSPKEHIATTCANIRRVTDHNELTFHMLEVIHLYLLLTQTKPPPPDVSNLSSSSASSNHVGELMPDGGEDEEEEDDDILGSDLPADPVSTSRSGRANGHPEYGIQHPPGSLRSLTSSSAHTQAKPKGETQDDFFPMDVDFLHDEQVQNESKLTEETASSSPHLSAPDPSRERSVIPRLKGTAAVSKRGNATFQPTGEDTDARSYLQSKPMSMAELRGASTQARALKLWRDNRDKRHDVGGGVQKYQRH